MKVVETALGKYIQWKLGKLNSGLDWDRLAAAVGIKANDEKSIVVQTTNTDSTFSFQYSDRSLDWLDYAPLEPTVLMRCTDKVFRAIITGKIGVDQAFYGNLVELEGVNLLREKFAANVLFDAFFTEEGYAKFAKTGNERRFQKVEEDYEPDED